MSTTTTPYVASGACPSFFRALCQTASERGSGGYESAGYGLAKSIASLCPNALEEAEWKTRVEILEAAIGRRPDDGAVLAWLDRELPRCMALVPRRHRYQFLKGAYRAWIDEEPGFGW